MVHQFPRRTLICGLLSCFALTACGCGESGPAVPELAVVTGEVKLDGKPAADVIVKFEPKSGGGPSTGVTDDDGKYVLKHNSGKDGAAVGDHVVRLSTFNEAEATVVIPAKYNNESTFTAKVEAGKDNEIPVFELTSK